jgi:acetyl-CoA carboxylase biotin carboxyl carrier protein
MNEKFIVTVIDKFAAADIAELDLDDGTSHLVLRKDAAFAKATALTLAAPVQAAAAHEPVHLGLAAQVQALPVAGGNETITSPIVGTFYGAPGPDAPPFVKAGSKVKAGDSLCILEAMKMMNHLEAEFNCEIVSVLAANGDLVEYGQALFEVKRL